MTVSFHLGYYWSDNKELRRLEGLFLETVSQNKDQILALLQEERSARIRSQLVHLLGWAEEYEEAPQVLISHFDEKSIDVANAAARALFPMAASGKVPLPTEEVLMLLDRRSKYLKNKALGLIALCPDTEKDKIIKFLDVSRIERLSRHKESIVRKPAKMLYDYIQDTQT
ncbi:MAG: hypothetical protein WDZ75_01005 [Candidatus Paceibacterota bacterium]